MELASKCNQNKDSDPFRGLLGLLLLFPLLSFAAGQPVADDTAQQATAPPESELLPQVMEEVDTSRDYISSKLVSFASEIDRFFGGERSFQETNKSMIQVDLTRLMEPAGNNQNALVGRLKLHLPSTEKRLHLVIESDPDKKTAVPEGQAAPAASAATKPESYSAALRVEKSKEERLTRHFSADVGVHFQSFNLRPFARARASVEMPLGEWRAKGIESLFWFSTTGGGETSQLDVERFWSESVLFRSTTALTWMYNTRNFDASQSLSAFHTLDERRALLYQASVVGVSRPQWQVTDYALLVSYRYRLHRKWIYFEVSPQLHFPRKDEYRLTPQLVLRLEFLFDDSR